MRNDGVAAVAGGLVAAEELEVRGSRGEGRDARLLIDGLVVLGCVAMSPVSGYGAAG